MENDFEQLDLFARQAAARPDVREAVAGLYADVQREIDARRPLCTVSGRCCRFEEYGHRLYVTTLELATFIHELARSQIPAAARTSASDVGAARPKTSLPVTGQLLAPGVSASGAGCPFQIDGLCSAHPFRPFGCRMFFCDATAAEWQNQAYERFHASLKALHESLGVPYFYLEWRVALRALGLDERDPESALQHAVERFPRTRFGC